MIRYMTGLWILMLLPAGVSSQQTFEFAGRTWETSSSDARVEEFMGREALRLRTGAAVLSDFEFQDGVIEYDFATTGHRSFVGVAFRLRPDPTPAYEHFYLRPHQTGRFDATQYTPEINGLAAWQLYPEFNALTDIPTAEWVHVRLVVTGGRMEAFVGDQDEPTLVVEKLRLDHGTGLVALTSNFPDGGSLDLYPSAFSNFTITPVGASGDAGRAIAESPPGTIRAWALSEAHAGIGDAAGALDPTLLRDMDWSLVETDDRGRLNIAEHRSFPDGSGAAHVYARTRIHSDRARVAALHFGFSDRGLVYLNGKLLFSANNTYRSRSGRYLGVMTIDNDVLYLPLNEGDNELVMVISESFGGWGLVARMDDTEGVDVDVALPDHD